MTSYEHKVKNIYLGGRYYAWYPLTEDANDISGNNHITTSGATSYGSDGAVFPNSNHNGLLIPFNIDFANDWTVLFYTKLTGHNGQQDTRLIDFFNTQNRIDGRVDTTTSRYMFLKNNSSQLFYSNYTIGQWLCIGITIKQGNVKIYTNGTLNGTTTFTGATQYFRFGQEYDKRSDRHIYGNIKDIIIDDRTRTDQEVTDYYNQTKSNYGIS